MKTYKVEDIIEYFDIFIGDEVEANNEAEAKELILDEIMDNIGNYIDIEVVEIEESDN